MTPLNVPLVRKARVEIVPLIDVIFFLLAAFVLVTLTMTRIRVLETTLPDSGKKSFVEPLVIRVTNHGALQWNDETIATDELPRRLGAYKQSTNEPYVLVKGDTTALFGTAVHVLDEVRSAGIAKVTIETWAR